MQRRDLFDIRTFIILREAMLRTQLAIAAHEAYDVNFFSGSAALFEKSAKK